MSDNVDREELGVRSEELLKERGGKPALLFDYI